MKYSLTTPVSRVPAEPLGAHGAQAGKAFGEAGETGDVGEQHGGAEGAPERFCFGRQRLDDLLDHNLGQVRQVFA